MSVGVGTISVLYNMLFMIYSTVGVGGIPLSLIILSFCIIYGGVATCVLLNNTAKGMFHLIPSLIGIQIPK